MRFEAITLHRVSGNMSGVTTEERIDGIVELTPMPNGKAYLMLPIEKLIERNEESRKRGLIEDTPLSKFDISKRGILELTNAESCKAITVTPGSEITIIRKGWGRVWEHRIKKL